MKVQAPKGTYDLLPENTARRRELIRRVGRILDAFGFSQIETPVFEASELFRRAVGDTTDIVSKEMYEFKDKGDRDLTLRPEGTAGVVRAYIENQLDQKGVERLWYYGPMFRYERPQAGRQRQFTQLGVEVFGDPGPVVDAEVIEMFIGMCRALGMSGLTVQLNSLGCATCKPEYTRQITELLRGDLPTLCPDCVTRLDKNPLRLLDCKRESCAPVLAKVPPFYDRLCGECGGHFGTLKTLLDELGIPYTLNPRLVRGLDYYTRTAFEIQIPGKDGAQNAIGGGGRYDLLVEQMGGRPTPGVGYAFGVERMLLLLEAQGVDLTPPAPPSVFVAWMGEGGRIKAVKLASRLRAAGVPVRVDGAGKQNLGKQLQKASKYKASVAAILGEDELKNETVTLKNLSDRSQKTVAWSTVGSEIQALLDQQASTGGPAAAAGQP